MKIFLVSPFVIFLLIGSSAFIPGDLLAYSTGTSSYEKGDYAKMFKEWKFNAERGFVKAQYNLGQMYRKGQGVGQDFKAAFKWYRLAAEQGNIDAYYALGVMYGNGDGVTRDFSRAHMWWNLAASQGNKNAERNRLKVEKQMTPADLSKAQDLVRECVAKNYRGC